MNKKRCFIVTVYGHWGRGETLRQAAVSCSKSCRGVPGGRADAFLIIGDDEATVISTLGPKSIIIGEGFTLLHLLCLEN